MKRTMPAPLWLRPPMRTFAFNKTVLRLSANQAVAENLPPALAATIPNLPELKSGKSFAVLCSGFACQPPIKDAAELRACLESATQEAACLETPRTKNGADGLYESVSPKIASPVFGPSYYRLLW